MRRQRVGERRDRRLEHRRGGFDRTLERRAGQPIETARFRPNIVVEGFEDGAEDGWTRLRAGGQELEFRGLCERCAMIQVDSLTAEIGPEPMRALKAERAACATSGRMTLPALPTLSAALSSKPKLRSSKKNLRCSPAGARWTSRYPTTSC